MNNLRLSPSTLGLIQNCERQFQYPKVLLLKPNSNRSDDLDRGSLIHFMLEELYNAIQQDAEIDRLALAEDIIFRAAVKRTGLFIEEEIWDTIQKSFREYVIYYARDWYPVEVERPFSKVPARCR